MQAIEMPHLPREVAVLDEADLRPLISAGSGDYYDREGFDAKAGGAQSRGASRALVILTLVVGVSGLSFGYDTGVISGALPYIRDDLLRGHAGDAARLAWLQECIVSATIVAAGVGSAVGGAFSDAFGRKRALLLADVLFTLGALGMGAAWSAGALITGRALVGLGVGLASVTVPVYIAECAPPAVRASLITANVLMITGGQFLAYAVDYIFTFVPGTWRWMLGVAALPSVAQAFGLLALPESPTWLAGRGRAAEAQKALAALQPGRAAAAAAAALAGAAAAATSAAAGATGAAGGGAGGELGGEAGAERGPPGSAARNRRARGTPGGSVSEEEGHSSGGWAEPQGPQAPSASAGGPGGSSTGLLLSHQQGHLIEEERAPLWRQAQQQEAGEGEAGAGAGAGGGSSPPPLAQQRSQQPRGGRQRWWAGRQRESKAAWRLLRSGPVLRQLHIGVGLQVLQQVCAINTVMYYTPVLLELAGFHNKQTALLLAMLPAGVNAAGTVVGMRCIDRFGRRRLLLTSIAAVLLTLSALGGAFYAAERHSPPLAPQGAACQGAPLPDCSACLRHGCGFCGAEAGDLMAAGTCLALGSDAEQQCAAEPGHMLYRYGCPSQFTVLILLGLMAYLAAFSPGLGPVPWAVNAEIYPLQVRGLATGLAATANWVSNAVVAQTFLTLTRLLGGSGVFWLYAGVAGAGLLWTWWFLPETNGLSLDQIQQLFHQRGAGKRRESDAWEAAGLPA